MATLSELNQIQRDIVTAEQEISRAKRHSARLAEIRNGEKPLDSRLQIDPYNREDPIRLMLAGAVNEFGPDMLRVLEMREDAKARAASARVRQLKAALNAAVDPEKESS